MSDFLWSLMSDYRLQMERHRNRRFLKASMAACALAAVADGEVSFGERIRVDQILDTLEQLKIFDPHEGVDLFNEYCQNILESPRAGRDAALTAVHRVTKDAQTATLLIRMCMAVAESVAESKGPANLPGKIEVIMLCSLLNVDPKIAGLYLPDDIVEPSC